MSAPVLVFPAGEVPTETPPKLPSVVDHAVIRHFLDRPTARMSDATLERRGALAVCHVLDAGWTLVEACQLVAHGLKTHWRAPAGHVITQIVWRAVRYDASGIMPRIERHLEARARQGVISKIMFDALCEEVPRFKKTWNRKRRDFTDDSLSSYDLALATYAAHAEWSDNEIAALIFAFRRKHGNAEDVKKGQRSDYLKRTIARARKETEATATEKRTDKRIEELIQDSSKAFNDAGKAVAKAVETAKRDELLSLVSEKLGFPVQGFKKYTGTPPRFELETTSGPVDLGAPEDVIRFQRFKARVYGVTGCVIPAKASKAFDGVLQMLSYLQEEVDLGPETTNAGILTAFICEHLSYLGWFEDSILSQQDTRNPFKYADSAGNVSVYITLGWLRNAINVNRRHFCSETELPRLLKEAGFTRRTLHVEVQGQRTTLSVYKAPVAVAEVFARDPG